jgi:hypothetical protein
MALRKKRWNNVDSFDAYVIFGDTEYRNAMLDGEIVRIRVHDYYAFKVDKRNQILCTYADKLSGSWL